MRTLLLVVAIASCGHSVDKTADPFCGEVDHAFGIPALTLGGAREVANAGVVRCSSLNAASNSLTFTMLGFQAAARPFRDRPEVRATLDALDKLPLVEIRALWCDEHVAGTTTLSPAEVKAMAARIDHVLTKLSAVTEACMAADR